MPKDARDRELARAAAKREREKHAATKKRSLVKATVSVVAVLVIAGVTYVTATSGKSGDSGPKKLDVLAPRPSPQGPCDFSPPLTVSAKMLVDKAPKMTIDTNRSYFATMDTSCGSMKVKLLSKEAPVTVNNFVFLARRHWYDGLLFHRVAASIDIIQTGDPACSVGSAVCGQGTPGYTFEDELTGKEKYTAGTVAMANSGPDTNGSQFFVATGPKASGLPPKYTIFGKLIGTESLQVAQLIRSLPVRLREGSPPGSEQDQLVDKVWIRSVKIQEAK